jgi:hypothetical protein
MAPQPNAHYLATVLANAAAGLFDEITLRQMLQARTGKKVDLRTHE